jgi:cytosine/adenosine deaminase-related metal-dependent hydrolase
MAMGTPEAGTADVGVADVLVVDAARPDGPSFADAAGGDAAHDAVGGDAFDALAEASSPGDASCALSGGPEVISTGVAGAYLLRGLVVGPDAAFAGEVLVVGSTLTCVAASCATTTGASTATVIDTHGTIFPGLVDTHNHILFDVFDETDWTPSKVYTNHNQWTAEDKYNELVNAKQYLNGESGSPWDYGCEMDKYGELKGLVAGTTSILGAANPANRACFGSLARTIDQSPNGLAADHVQVATLFPNKTSADGVCSNFASADTDAYLIHIAEGVDTTAHNEFAKLEALTTTPMCLFAPQTTIVHGTALVDADFAQMATDGMSLTWSPRSNVFLYGGGTDLTKTTNIPVALSHGLNISIAPDWSIGGSQNMLDELRFAHKVDLTNPGWGVLSSQDLFNMATKNPAKALGLSGSIGSLAVGLRADVMVISGDTTAPYDALLAATPREVRLVMVDGVPLYGDAGLQSVAPIPVGASACETIDVCCGSKFACVSRPSKVTGDKLDQTYSLIQASLIEGFADYDAMALSPYTFSPLTPLVRCSQ